MTRTFPRAFFQAEQELQKELSVVRSHKEVILRNRQNRAQEYEEREALDRGLAEQREEKQLDEMRTDLQLELEQVPCPAMSYPAHPPLHVVTQRVCRGCRGCACVSPTAARPPARPSPPARAPRNVQCKLQYEDSTRRRTAQVYKQKCVCACLLFVYFWLPSLLGVHLGQPAQQEPRPLHACAHNSLHAPPRARQV